MEEGIFETRGHEQVTKQKMTGNPVWGNQNVRQRECPASLKFSQIYFPV